MKTRLRRSNFPENSRPSAPFIGKRKPYSGNKGGNYYTHYTNYKLNTQDALTPCNEILIRVSHESPHFS